MSLQLYYDWTYWSTPVAAGVTGPAGTLVDSLETDDVDFQHRFRLGDNRIIWGLGYRLTLDSVQNPPSLGFVPTNLDHRLLNGFMQDEVTLAEDWSLTLGSKVEHNDYTGFEFEPSGRLAWTFAERQVLWAAVSRAVRTPSRIDRDFIAPNSANPSFLAGNSNFISETLMAYELGYRAQLTQEFSTSISAFYNQYDNLRSLSLTNGALPYVITNNVAGQTNGLELTADLQVQEGWRLHGGYDLLNEYLQVKSGLTDTSNAMGNTADPPNQVFLRSSMDLGENLELDPALRWVDTVYNNNGTSVGTVPYYFELDVRFGWLPVKNLEQIGRAHV